MEVNDCPLSSVLKYLNGKWEPVILKYIMINGSAGYSEISKNIKNITPKALNNSLKRLINGNIIEKLILSEIPYRVSYTLSEKGMALKDPLNELESIQRKCPENNNI